MHVSQLSLVMGVVVLAVSAAESARIGRRR